MKEVYARNEFATLEITLVLKRNDPYYTLTWFVPIMVLTFLTPIGLILPGKYLMYFPYKTCSEKISGKKFW